MQADQLCCCLYPSRELIEITVIVMANCSSLLAFLMFSRFSTEELVARDIPTFFITLCQLQSFGPQAVAGRPVPGPSDYRNGWLSAELRARDGATVQAATRLPAHRPVASPFET